MADRLSQLQDMVNQVSHKQQLMAIKLINLITASGKSL